MNPPIDTGHQGEPVNPGTPGDGTGAGPGAGDPGTNGPRVTREEARDLARLRRSRADRKVAGVAGGLARHFDVDPLLLRVAFVILTFFGGGGILLYGVAWLVVPEEDTGEAVVKVDDGIRTAVLVIAGALAAASLVGDSVGGFGFPWPLMVAALVLLVIFGSKEAMKPGGPTHPLLGGPPRPEGAGADATGATPYYAGYHPGPPPTWSVPRPHRGPILFWFTLALAALLCGALATADLEGLDVHPAAYPATVLATTGLMLLVGAFYGRAGGLILVGLLAAVSTVGATVTDDWSAGEVERTPQSAAELRDEDLGIGEIKVDLTEVKDLDELDGDTLRLDLRVGRIEVIVPDEGLTVIADAEAEGVGEVKLFGDKSDQSDRATHDGGDEAPTLTIEADAFMAEIVIHTEEQAR